MKKIEFKKVVEWVRRPKVLVWLAVLLTLIAVGLAIKLTVWEVYTEDQPKAIPEETRKDIRGVVHDAAQAIKKVSEPLGMKIEEAEYKAPSANNNQTNDETANWPVYENAEIGISLRYPPGWAVAPGENSGNLSITNRADEYSGIYFYSGTASESDVLDWWAAKIKNWDTGFGDPGETYLGGRRVLVYREVGGMQGVYYVFGVNGRYYYVGANGQGNNYVEEVINTIH